MKNPNGPYPGRQLFLGVTKDEKPAFAYLVTGRSPQSRERKAILKKNKIIIGPTGSQAYDPLRHYTAVQYDDTSGLLAVSNGIQTEAIYETYRLLYHVKSAPTKGYPKKIMDGANFEPDSLQTPRIAGVITSNNNKPVYIISIKTAGKPAFTWQVKPELGTIIGVATFHGNMESPEAFNTDNGPAILKCSAVTPQEMTDFIYEISAATHQGDDIRVCTIGGIRGEDNIWTMALLNKHKS